MAMTAFAVNGILRAVKTLVPSMRRAAEGDLTDTPASLGEDEVGRMAGLFGRMLKAIRETVLEVFGVSGEIKLSAQAILDGLRGLAASGGG